MPFINSEENQIALSRSIGLDPIEVDNESTFKEQLTAAYRTENTIGSFFARDGQLPDSAVTNPEFNPFNYLTEDEKLDERFTDQVSLADNTDEIEGLRRQRDRENADREVLANGGFLAAAMVATADPVNLLPVGGTAYRTYKGGASILKAGVVTAGSAAASATAAEAGLHYSQIQRTYGESAVNISAAALFGSVLGMAPAALRKTFEDAGHNFDEAMEDIEKSFDPEIAENPAFSGELRSVGAMQALDDVEVRGKLAKAMTKYLGFDPLSKNITSDVKETRVITSQLVENPIAMDKPIGPSVESKVKTASDGFLYEGISGHHKIFKEYQKSGGKLSRKDFNEATSKAIRNGSNDPMIQKAADHWQSKVYSPIKNQAIQARLLPEDVEVTTAQNYLNRLWNKQKIAANLTRFNDIVSDWLVKRQPDMDLGDARELASEIAEKIMGTPDGRIPYSYQVGDNITKSGSSTKLRGPFKKRSFDIDDELVEDFLENDIEFVASRYVKNTIPDIELTRQFGDVEMKAEEAKIAEGWRKKMDAAKTEKERLKLSKLRDRDIKNLAAMRDRIRGVYNIPDSNNFWVRAGRVSRDLNYMRLLGGVVAASIPDVARIVMAEGLGKTFSKGLKPLVTNLSSFHMAAEEAKLYGVGVDALIGGRSEIIADVADYAAGGTAFERGVRSAATKFSSINLMNYWTSGVKQLHAVVTQSRIGDDLLAGKYDPRLGQLGIDEANAKGIAGQLKKYGQRIDGVWVANTKDWDSPGLAEIWRTGIRKESDRVIIVPGQEKPLFMSNELGKTIFQFKTFMFSSTQRVLISSLQNQDKHALQGILGLVSLGSMSYAFKQWDAGREISNDPRTLLIEGIDRSGVTGWLMEANNTIEKITGNTIGARPLLGVSAPASRYASRSTLDSLVGPTFGLADTVIKVAGAATDQNEWTEADTRALRRLIPGQNLSLLRQWFDKLEESIYE